jgi:hypothetical protein
MINVTATNNETAQIARSVAKWAELIGVSSGLLSLEASRGRLKVARVGRRVVILAEEMQRYLNEGGPK